MILEVNIPDDEFREYVDDILDGRMVNLTRYMDAQYDQLRRHQMSHDSTLTIHSAFIIGLCGIVALLSVMVVSDKVMIGDLNERLKQWELENCCQCTESQPLPEVIDTSETAGSTSDALGAGETPTSSESGNSVSADTVGVAASTQLGKPSSN